MILMAGTDIQLVARSRLARILSGAKSTSGQFWENREMSKLRMWVKQTQLSINIKDSSVINVEITIKEK